MIIGYVIINSRGILQVSSNCIKPNLLLSLRWSNLENCHIPKSLTFYRRQSNKFSDRCNPKPNPIVSNFLSERQQSESIYNKSNHLSLAEIKNDSTNMIDFDELFRGWIIGNIQAQPARARIEEEKSWWWARQSNKTWCVDFMLVLPSSLTRLIDAAHKPDWNVTSIMTTAFRRQMWFLW